MSSKGFDDLILQVFEASPERFFFPIVSQQQAKAFVKALHCKGLGYNNISDEINESNERFSTWRRSLSCNMIGQLIIKRINQPLLQLLEEEDSNINTNYESLFDIEQDISLLDKQNFKIKKKFKFWRFLRHEDLKTNSNNFKKLDSLSINGSSIQNNSTANMITPKVSRIVVDSVLPETSKNNVTHKAGHVDCEEDNQIFIKNMANVGKAKLKISKYYAQNCVIESPKLKFDESKSWYSPDISSSEEQFYDCDSFKSCSPAFVDNSQGCILKGTHHKTIFGQNLKSSIEILNPLSPLTMETYNSDLDESCYEDIPPNLSEIEQLLKILKASKGSAHGFFYVFCDDNLCPNVRLMKIGVSRKPHKKLSQAQVFNTRLALLNTIKVSDMGEVLTKARQKLSRWKVDGHLDWFQGNEELLHELRTFMQS